MPHLPPPIPELHPHLTCYTHASRCSSGTHACTHARTHAHTSTLIVSPMDLFLAGVKSLLVRHACIGKASADEGYARFAIENLTSKANPRFQITGVGSKGDGDTRKSVGQAPSSANGQNTHHWRT
jgi:hypothetical protein